MLLQARNQHDEDERKCQRGREQPIERGPRPEGAGYEKYRENREETLPPRHPHGDGRLVVFLQVQMTAVLSLAQYRTSLSKHGLGHLAGTIHGALLGEKLQFVPILPCFQRLVAAGIARKSNAEALIDMKADYLDSRASGEVRSFFPERSVCSVVILADAQLVDRPFAPSQDVWDDFA